MNALHLISPYKQNGQWVFDDPSKQLDKEPFVSGADTLLDLLTGNGSKCTLIFSDVKFPSAEHRLQSISTESDGSEGTFYRHVATKHELWLCPALLKYFALPPKEIFVQVK